MTDIGIVGLDTSHAEGFAARIDEHESTTLTAVWDGGEIRDESYEQAFCEEHGAQSYEEPFEMADDVDAVMVLTVDWDSHTELSTPFLECGVPTLIDKPIAGSVADVDEVRAVTNGTPLFGGSAVPYHSELRSLANTSIDGTLYCVGYDDPFYYGVHLVDTVCRAVDEDWACVTPADDPGLTVDVVYEDGTFATLRLDGSSEDGRFAFLGVGESTAGVDVGSSRADLDDMYRSYFDTFLDAVSGDVDVSHRLLDAASLLIAIDAALTLDRPITPDCSALAEHHVDAQSFVEDYQPYY